MAASARWTGQQLRFEVSDTDGHSAAVDEPPQSAGFSPPDLLLAALAACTGITAVSLLQKMRQPLRALTVSAEGDRQPDWPKAFTEIRVHYALEGEGKFDEALVRKAVDLATKRYCAVGGTIELGEGGCRIVSDYSVR